MVRMTNLSVDGYPKRSRLKRKLSETEPFEAEQPETASLKRQVSNGQVSTGQVRNGNDHRERARVHPASPDLTMAVVATEN
jgi:hypothetical protein